MLPLDALGGVLGVVALRCAAAVALATVGEAVAPASVLVFVRGDLGSFALTALHAQALGSGDAIRAFADTKSLESSGVDASQDGLAITLPPSAELGDGEDGWLAHLSLPASRRQPGYQPSDS